MSYSLRWEDNGKRLAGLVILAGDGEFAVATAPQTSARNVEESAFVAAPDAADRPTELVHDQYDDGGQLATDHSRRDADRLDHEARMAEEREKQEAEMEQRRQEEEIASEACEKEEEVRDKAWVSDYLKTYGPNLDK